MNTYLYETHLHTYPVSGCAQAGVRETLKFYKELGYAGIFLTNHFIDGHINFDRSAPYKDLIEFYFSDYEEALRIGKEIGLSVFSGLESGHNGTDFLIYGLDKAWFLAHPEIHGMKKSTFLTMAAEAGALIIQAHPFRDAEYMDHMRLYPRHVHGLEVYNASRRNEYERTLAEILAENYHLLRFAGSDNHIAGRKTKLGGMRLESPILNEADFVERVKNGKAKPFYMNLKIGRDIFDL